MMLALSTLIEAKMVNGIAMVVEGEPITTAEIKAVQDQYNLSKAEAIDMLVQDRLQKVATKDIVISEEEIDRKINEIAAKNGVTIPQMQEILKDQGTSWSQYRDSVRQALKKEKFFKENVVANIPTPGEDELKLFYQHHKKNFVIPSTIKTQEYSSSSKKAMQRFLKTRNTKGIKVRTLTQNSKKINPALLSVLLSTPVGSLTKPFNTGDKYVLYKVLEKNGKVQLPYNVARNAVIVQWRKAQEGKALKDYFEKLRTRADIQIVR